ncbi:MAG: hypothetical protein AAGI88_25910 [Pseudomonadota bacterium]
MSDIWLFIKERWHWLVGALLLAGALYQKRSAEHGERRARDMLTDNQTAEIKSTYAEVDANVDKFNAAQKRNRESEHRLNRRLDDIAKHSDDTARIISDWNADNRLHDEPNFT